MKPTIPDPNAPQDRSRMIIAVVISLAILLGFNHFVEKPRMEEARRQAEIVAAEKSAPAVAVTKDQLRSRQDVIADGKRIPIAGKKVAGSIALKGAVLDDLTLNNHYTSVARDQHVALLSPSGTEHAFFTGGGWLSSDAKVSVPDENAVWKLASGSATRVESGGAPVVLEWDNGQGLVFKKSITVDDDYLFEVTDSVINKSVSDVKLSSYHLISRRNRAVDFSGMFILHEGPVGYLNGKSYNPNYDDLLEGEKLELNTVSGWLGITDKYWMVALLPEPSAKFDARVVGSGVKKGEQHYQADVVSQEQTVAAGTMAEQKSYIYAGVKNLPLMQDYESKYNFDKLDLSMDFGMWWFITIPFYKVLHLLAQWSGNIAIAILLMTVLVRGAVFPLASKSFKSMAKMKIVSPKLKELQEKHGDDKATLQMEIFELYKREDVNPLSGCWPMLIQIPIFFALYKVILLSVELRHAPFWGWVHDLSAPDPTSIANLFGLIPWTPPSALMIGAWPLLFCLTMIVQKRLSPPMPDEMQEKIQGWFPYIITVMLAHFAAGLVIYWTWSNVLGILQQYYILRTFGGEETSLIRGHASRRKKKK